MNEPLKEFSQKIADDIKAALASQQTEEFIKTVKASGEDRTFEVVMSTADEDRQGDELDQSKWDLKYFDLNPVVLWAHNYSSFPIGIVTDIQIQGNKAIATGKFAPAGVNPEADMACALYQQKILRAVSPGYIQNDDGTRELLELSFCPVPAGKFALSLRQVSALGVSTQELVTKGYFYEAKGAVAYKDHGTADPDEAWDGPAEVKACGDDMDKLKSICAWFDSDNADVKSAYKLPHHRASDLKAVWNGVKAAAAALQGGRGGVDIPSGDIARVKAHIASHYKEFGKTPPWEEKSEKTERVGDTCELEDGTPGTLTENPDSPGTLICVPNEKSQKNSNTSMKDELKNNFKAEHERHQKAFAKAIDEFKGIDEFEKSIDGEQDEHLTNTMKAIDEGYELQDQKKSIDDFKSAMQEEHLTHVKASDKAIDEFKSAHEAADGDDEKTKAIEEFTKAVGEELDRHEKAHKELCEAEFGGGDDDEKKSLDIGVSVGDLTDEDLVKVMQKAGRAISAKNKEKLKAILEKMDSHHNDVTAALKELIGSDEGDGGEEPSPKPEGEKPEGDEKALNSRSSTSGAAAELETYLFTQRLVRQVKTASEGALRQINEKIRLARSSGR
jgi:hypothetical protein